MPPPMRRANKTLLLGALALAGCAHEPAPKPASPAVPAAFSQAGAAAELALGEGDGRNAVRQQEQALKSLRRGAKSLADARDQNGEGQGRPGSMTGRNGSATQKDPFGRDVGKGSADEDLNQDYRAGSERNKKYNYYRFGDVPEEFRRSFSW